MAQAQTADTPNTFEQRRRAEIERGRARLAERQKLSEVADKDVKTQTKAGDEQLKDDERRRHELLNAEPDSAKADRDRAGAEIADQAQTELEGLIHFADREETITTASRQIAVEEMEDETADPGAATEVTVKLVEAQAVNQPTPMANERGQETEDRPLNNTDLPDARLSPRTEMPSDKHVPKTREKAKRVARGKVPPAEEVVVPGWHQPDANENENVAVEAVGKVEDEILG